MFFLNPNFYYVTIALQAFCVFHCIRKGNQNKWIWVIVFLPLVGCLIYIFTEIVNGRDIQKVQSGLAEVLNPSGSIRKLEENLRFADTFNNKVALADACLAAGEIDRSIELYENSLKGAFEENEHVLSQLTIAYYKKQRYADLIAIAEKIYRLPQFPFFQSHILYAQALSKVGLKEKAEKEFKKMNGKYSHYEGRYYYGLFLLASERENEARKLFMEIESEASHLSTREKRYYRDWFIKTKEELKRMEVPKEV
jgi:hypothetical protein